MGVYGWLFLAKKKETGGMHSQTHAASPNLPRQGGPFARKAAPLRAQQINRVTSPCEEKTRAGIARARHQPHARSRRAVKRGGAEEKTATSVAMFAQPRIFCSRCRTLWQDFGYSSAGHLVFTRAECQRLEAGDEIRRRSPIRYRSLHDAEGIPTTREPDEDFF